MINGLGVERQAGFTHTSVRNTTAGIDLLHPDTTGNYDGHKIL